MNLGRYVSFLLLMTLALPAAYAQSGDVRAEVAALASIAEQKFIGLAETMTQEHYASRPQEGVRSVAEVFTHIAGNNYWLPIYQGQAPAPGVPITPDYQSVVQFEKQTDKAEIVAALKASFAFYKEWLANVDPETLDEPMDIFGQRGTVRSYLIMTATHMHEHLGQAIAYARMNEVTPPWSR